MSSMITTVLPTPAPPNRPILPPLTNGAIRSTTLMPVSNTSVLGSRSTNFGVSRWIGQRSADAGIAGPSSTGSPNTFRMRPSAACPTGTEIGAPVSSTGIPRTTPSVVLMATARPRLLHQDGVIELGKLLRLELDVDDRPDDLDDTTDVRRCRRLRRSCFGSR